MRPGTTSHEIWREHTSSVRFLLERAETEGGRASGSFGPPNQRIIGAATALALVCRRCDVERVRHAGRDHDFVGQATPRVAYRFTWSIVTGGRGEIEFDDTLHPVWKTDGLR